jgi:hypothetical protein
LKNKRLARPQSNFSSSPLAKYPKKQETTAENLRPSFPPMQQMIRLVFSDLLTPAWQQEL